MDIEGSKLRFTPSEAHWAQEASVRSRIAPDLARRILDARIELAEPWLSSTSLPAFNLDIAMADVTAHLDLIDAMDRLHNIALQHTSNEDGEEREVITVEASHDEKVLLLRLAEVDYEVAREQLDTPEMNEIEDRAIKDNFATFFSDSADPEEAAILRDMLLDPESIAQNEALQNEKAMQHVRILEPVITALQADLA